MNAADPCMPIEAVAVVRDGEVILIEHPRLFRSGDALLMVRDGKFCALKLNILPEEPAEAAQ